MGTLTDVPRPATGKTPLRNFRINGEFYDPAVRIAWARGESLTDVVEKAIAAYARRHRAEDPGPEAYAAARLARTAREMLAVAEGKPETRASKAMRAKPAE